MLNQMFIQLIIILRKTAATNVVFLMVRICLTIGSASVEGSRSEARVTVDGGAA